MKKATYIFTGCLAVVLLAIALVTSSHKADSKISSLASSTTETQQSMKPRQRLDSNSIQNRDDELLVRKEPPVDLASLGIDPSPFKQETDNPALIQILARHQPPSVGSVKPTDTNSVVLELKDGRRFEAVAIGDTRSQAADGTVALNAVTSRNREPLKIIEGETIPGNPGEIWIIGKDGKSERISPPHVHADHPIISPDGRYVAFVARYLVSGALHPKVLLMLDRMSGQLSSYADRKYGADYEISPIDWVEGGKVLRVIEDWGETGGHIKLKEVRVE